MARTRRSGRSQSVKVDEYRLPTMKATITGPKTALVRPAAVPLSLFVGYLSGGPAPNIPVELRTNFRSTWSPPEDYKDWDFDGQPVKEGVVQLDDSGDEPSAELPLARSVPLETRRQRRRDDERHRRPADHRADADGRRNGL